MRCISACRQPTRALVLASSARPASPAVAAAPAASPSAALAGTQRNKPANMPGEPHVDYNARWENMWQADGGLKPGQAFDAATSPPILSAQLASGALAAAGKRVLIPGCGRGYDLVAFVRAGAELAAGLELAPTAQQAASQYVEGTLSKEELTKAQVFAADFFKWQHPSGHPTFDLGWDYTFLCALHPDMRSDWAAAWARLLHTGAQLACLAFPIDPERTTGPPWPVTAQLYRDLLLPAGFTLEREEAVPPELSHPGRGGKECLLVFSRL